VADGGQEPAVAVDDGGVAVVERIPLGRVGGGAHRPPTRAAEHGQGHKDGALSQAHFRQRRVEPARRPAELDRSPEREAGDIAREGSSFHRRTAVMAVDGSSQTSATQFDRQVDVVPVSRDGVGRSVHVVVNGTRDQRPLPVPNGRRKRTKAHKASHLVNITNIKSTPARRARRNGCTTLPDVGARRRWLTSQSGAKGPPADKRGEGDQPSHGVVATVDAPSLHSIRPYVPACLRAIPNNRAKGDHMRGAQAKRFGAAKHWKAVTIVVAAGLVAAACGGGSSGK